MKVLHWRAAVDEMREVLGLLETAAIPIVELPDAAGAVRDIERRLADLRHRWNEQQVEEARDPESELGPPTLERTQFGSQKVQVTGREYRTVTTRSAKRTYNTTALLWGIARGLEAREPQAGPVSELNALRYCIVAGVASVKWAWTPLTRLARDLGMALHTVPHAVAEGDDLGGPQVGETWVEQVRQEAVKEET